MYVIGLREDLLTQVSKHFQLQVVHTLSALPTSAIDERILVDANSVDHLEVYEYKQARPEMKITLILDEITNAFASFAKTNEIHVVTPSKLISYLQEEVPQDNPKPILAFWGVLPRLGTTTIAMSVARTLANDHNQSVGMFSLNAYSPGHWFLSEHNHHLDNLHSYIQANQLDRELLLQSMEYPHKVRYLLGERNQTKALDYTPEDVSYLIEVARSNFDVIVLDIGSILNTALALQGLLSATHHYVIANDSLMSKDAFDSQYDYVLRPLGLDRRDFVLIGNQLRNKNVQSIAKSIDVNPVAAIPEFLGIQMISEQSPDGLKPILSEKQFKRAIDSISAAVVNTSNVVGARE